MQELLLQLFRVHIIEILESENFLDFWTLLYPQFILGKKDFEIEFILHDLLLNLFLVT